LPFRLFVVVALSLTVARGVHAQSGSDPLQLTLECERAPELTFRLTVRNIGSAPTAAVVGSILGNDRQYLLGSLAFVLSRDGSADTYFDYVDPTVAAVGGRVDPWLVTLPAAASYSVAVSIPRGFRDLFSSPAEVSVRLKTRELQSLNSDVQGLSFVHVWVGTLTSERIPFPGSCRH